MGAEPVKDRLHQLEQALSQLRTIKSSMPAVMPVIEGVVNQYHQALSRVEAAGLDMSEFKIAPSEIVRNPLASDSSGRPTKFSNWRYVERTLFIARLQGASDFLASVLSNHLS
ncbi:MAG: hypothetical protein IT330_02830 [Anaerolineae bacterium]|nr:hypothetical protein [Anaerolineae bacterium]